MRLRIGGVDCFRLLRIRHTYINMYHSKRQILDMDHHFCSIQTMKDVRKTSLFSLRVFFFRSLARVYVSRISRTCYKNFLFPMIQKFFGSILAPGENAFSC